MSAVTPRRMTKPLMYLMAVASGTAIGNLYYIQPLLSLVAADLHAPESMTGMLVTVTQVGYALGLLFIVPLGDFRDRSLLVPSVMLVSAAGLVIVSVSTNVVTMLVGLGVVGLTSISSQILAPLAADLATDDERGKVLGVVFSGLVTGITVARVFSGAVADVGGWRLVFGSAAVVVVLLAVLIRRCTPRSPPRPTEAYWRVLASAGGLVVREPTLRVTMCIGALGFGAFTMYWTCLTFLLSAPRFGYSTTTIGLFAVIGLVGVVAAQSAGRLHDRGWNVRGTGMALLLVLTAWIVMGFGGNVITLVIAATVILEIGVQTLFVMNQSRLFQLVPHARSRVNTPFVVGNFVGGAVGAVASSVLWVSGGWKAVAAVGAAVAAVALAIWMFTRRGALVVQPADVRVIELEVVSE